MPTRTDSNLQSIKKPDFILKLEKAWRLRVLTTDCVNELESFIELFDDFFQLCEGDKGSGFGILNMCPPSKDIHTDKFVLGLYDEHALIGLLDIIRDYPAVGVWTIGYLLIHPTYRSQGIGGKFIKDLETSLTPFKLRCIVQRQNVRALDFWKSNGFLMTSQSKDTLGNLVNVNYILEK